MPDVHVAEVAAFAETDRKVVEILGLEVGIFRLGGQFFAYENKCPHQEGPVCQGKILPLTTEDIQPDGTSKGRIFSKMEMNVVCPWHGFEFDIRTGMHPMNSTVRLRRIPVKVVDGGIYLSLGSKNEKSAH